MFGRACVDFNADDSSVTNTGHVLLALKVANFTPVERFKREVDAAVREIRDSERMEGVERIWLPGEQSYHRKRDRRANGVPLSPALRHTLNELATSLGLDRTL